MLARLRSRFARAPPDPHNEYASEARRIAQRRSIISAVFHRVHLVQIAFFAVGYIWMLCLPMQELQRQTYIDENALQPGQVDTYWSWHEVHIADRYLDQLEALRDRNATSEERAAFLNQEFKKLGLPSATQKYSLKSSTGESTGINTYASLAAPRISGAEAIVISASWNSLLSTDTSPALNLRGIATILSLAGFIKRYSHWAKDILFVINDGHLEGMHAFLSAYHGVSQPNMIAEPLTLGAGGVIWTALSVDYPGHSFSHIGIFYEGLNARLPNQDLLNSVQVITRWTGSCPTILYDHLDDYSRPDYELPFGMLKEWINSNPVKEFEMRAGSILRHVGYQYMGRPSGVHGLFHQFRIDAITLFAYPATGPHGFHTIGKTIESSLRTMNNLLERLHASYFFYIMTGPGTFLQIGKYLTAAVLVGIALEFGGLKAWVDSGWEEFEVPLVSGKTLKEEMVEGPNKEHPSSNSQTTNGATEWRRRRRPIIQALYLMLGTHALGGVVFSLITTSWFVQELEARAIAPLSVLAVLSFSVLVLLHPSILSSAKTSPLALLLKAFTQCLAGTTICIISVVNFSLAAVMGILLGIPFFLSSPSQRTHPSKRSSSGLFPTLTCATGFLAYCMLTPMGLCVLASGALGIDQVASAVRRTVWEFEALGVWFLPFVCVVYLPLVWQAALVCILSL
ncbi:hypothetical protein BOTBODRAFT_29295 [Botryobasidium botryosum FD-172 SS1]|uniref:Uncharacterized protein n=1 Tax=Botryobasidium botryosum (strain FD-172 SS1) TaxID=930990 RepID=A0A067MTE1_BOTB1|nr:hypothetical protein BOTBODRAFT_29295 [Botryobasidium botryosum FD-172 SS1]